MIVQIAMKGIALMMKRRNDETQNTTVSPNMVFRNQTILVVTGGRHERNYLANRKDGRIIMQTKTQEIINRLQRRARRTQAQTWADVEKLSKIVRSDKHDRDFYQQANRTACAGTAHEITR